MQTTPGTGPERQLGIQSAAQPGARASAEHRDPELHESQAYEATSRMEHQDNHDGLRERERDVDGVQGVESLHPHDDAAEHPGNEGDRTRLIITLTTNEAQLETTFRSERPQLVRRLPVATAVIV